jgi:hypothetical protein
MAAPERWSGRSGPAQRQRSTGSRDGRASHLIPSWRTIGRRSGECTRTTTACARAYNAQACAAFRDSLIRNRARVECDARSVHIIRHIKPGGIASTVGYLPCGKHDRTCKALRQPVKCEQCETGNLARVRVCNANRAQSVNEGSRLSEISVAHSLAVACYNVRRLSLRESVACKSAHWHASIAYCDSLQ